MLQPLIASQVLLPKTEPQVEIYLKEALLDLDIVERQIELGVDNPDATYQLMQSCALKSSILRCLAIPFISLPPEVKQLANKYAMELKIRYEAISSQLSKISLISLSRPAFIEMQGSFPAKRACEDGKITVLSWNICALEGSLPMLFGGVRPWAERVDGIVGKIVERGADIVCLQEVFSEDCAELLYEKLKGEYAYFYINIGPKDYSFDLDKIGKLSSGLFVASKYILERPSFYAYDVSKQETEAIRGYGVFLAHLLGKLCIATTHLQPGVEDSDKEIRANQIAAIERLCPEHMPTFLFLDTNIEYGNEEYNKAIIPTFFNHYKAGKGEWTCCELRDFWFNPEQYTKMLSEGAMPFEHIDAVLEVKRSSKAATQVECKVISVGDLEDPLNALSDHRALQSTITF
jgi:endonuclease/exonuclease/phosphatase family metal-dependent hydrolase